MDAPENDCSPGEATMARARLILAVSLALLAGAAVASEASETVKVDQGAVRLQSTRAARFDAAALDGYVQARNGILDCYREELGRDRRARGRLLVRFTIARSGEVGDVTVVKSGLSPRLVECVTALMASWQTPFRPEAPVFVECPLVFAAGG
jgi:outer membrane biosynthesis protein TonB